MHHDAHGLRILSFDGGGVRGKASLLLLKRIMDAFGPGAKPCNFFDLIGGSSTGALIAIMLAILEYTVDQAIAKYNELGPMIFARVAPERVWLTSGIPRVDEGPAERAFQDLVGNRFMEGGRCKCFVTTVLQDRPGTLIPIRSYACDDGADPIISLGKKWKVWQAARAATAATVYFKPFELERRQFIDAALGYNNPSVEIYHEITTNIPDFRSLPIACFVSIGTGTSNHHPAPSISDDFLSPIKLLAIKERGARLVQCLAAIAANTARVDREMRRNMPNGSYFRFDPGRDVGSIEFSDISHLPRMEHLVWDHMRDNPTIIDQLRDCTQTLRATSFLAVNALAILNSTPSITESDDVQTISSVVSSLPPRGGWLSVITLVEYVLMNPDAIPMFLLVFSVYRSLEHVFDILSGLFHRRMLDSLSMRFNSSPLNGGTGTQVCILTLVINIVSNLWLRDEQIHKICQHFDSRTTALHSSVTNLQSLLRQALEKAKKENDYPNDDECSLDIERTDFAAEVAQALAHSEYALRRTDPVGECVRWLAKGCTRDFLSFPERVTCWVLQSILDSKPENMGKRYRLFYKVAKRSKDIHNFSAMLAIVLALQPLELLRTETRVQTSQLKNMLALGSSHVMLKRQNLNHKKPYLYPLEFIVKSRPSISESDVADHHHYIHWDHCQQLYSDINAFATVQDPPLTSSQEYNRNQAVGFVRRSLLHINVVDDKPIPDRVEAAIRQFRDARSERPPLFQGQHDVRRSVVITDPADPNR